MGPLTDEEPLAFPSRRFTPELIERFEALGLWTHERIGWSLTRAAERWGDVEALVFEGRRWTYSALRGWVTVVAHDLVRAGLRSGDRLVWQLGNSAEALVLHQAAWRIGLISVPVVPIYREHEMAHILRDARPAGVAFSSRLGERRLAEDMAALLDELDIAPRVRVAIGAPVDGWDELAAAPPTGHDVDDSGLPDPAAHDAPCLLLYTSGTTAAPKGAMHSSESLLAEAKTLRDSLGFSYRDVFVMGAPITHIAGLLLTAIVPATCGARSVLLAAWDGDEAVRLAHEEEGTFSCGATVFLQGFVERYEADVDAKLHRLGGFMCGGSAIPPSLVERAEAVGIRAFRSWGMTEVPTVGLAGPDVPLARRAQTDGRVSEGSEVRAIGDDGRPLPPGTAGELCVRAPEQMLGYTDLARDAEHVDAEGWFRTGDVGSVDADGWITMTGRIKDIINRGGEKFSAQDIENVIAAHPNIASAAVIGAPDERLGEKVVAFVTLRAGAHWPGGDVLRQHLESSRLAKPKWPVAWRVVDEVPATLSGKTQKNVLLDRWNAGGDADPG